MTVPDRRSLAYHFWTTAREYVTHWAVAGAVLALSGFAPDHWFANLFEHIHIPDALRRFPSADYRLVAVCLGVAIIVGDTLLRNRKRTPTHTPIRNGLDEKPDSEQEPRAVAPRPNEAPPLRDKPSIAVLPFQNISGDLEQEYFADGMVDEIITALSRIRWLFVIARNSSFTYKGQVIDVKRVGRELDVRYVLEGSARKGGDRVRITAQLIDADTGVHLWADHFDGALSEVFELQDRIAARVVGAIEPALEATEIRRSSERPTKDLTAYDFYLRALPDCYSHKAEAQRRARELLDQAIARDPSFGPALARAAHCCFLLVFYGRSEDPAADAARGIDYARRALAAAGDDPAVLVHAAQTLAYFGEDIDAMIALCDRALSLNPNFARGWQISGVLRRWAGQTDIGIEHVETSMRLSPRTRVGTAFFAIGQAHFLARRFEEAEQKLLVAIQDDPSYPEPYRTLAACYAHMGRLDDAEKVVARLRAITPIVIPDASYLRNPEQRELYLSGLRLAVGELALQREGSPGRPLARQ